VKTLLIIIAVVFVAVIVLGVIAEAPSDYL
jgi:hypothetical protein